MLTERSAAPERGRVVISRAGKDRGCLLAVLSHTGRQVLVCDGKGRPLERPKAKNQKHVVMTSQVLREEDLVTNRAIRRALRKSSLALPEKKEAF